MKRIIFSLYAVSAVLVTSCNSNGKKESELHEVKNASKDTMQHAIDIADKEVKVVAVLFTNVGARAANSIKEIIGNYLQIKNALANDDATAAANSGKIMNENITKLDKSLLTASQKKLFDSIAESLKEGAEHIGNNDDEIIHQREHFATMSEAVYLLVKAFGAGKPIYQDHCPMYNENKGGAMWLSEIKAVNNPYFGTAMSTCGSVKEIIK